VVRVSWCVLQRVARFTGAAEWRSRVRCFFSLTFNEGLVPMTKGKGKKGGGGKKGAGKQHGGNHGGGGKVDERRERQRMRKEERLAQWHDPKWKQEFLRFEAQLKLLGLRIVDMTGDGNCLFRSVCDQMEGSADAHGKTRRECVAFLRQFSDEFRPFLDTEEQSFDDYCKEMSEDGEWGGNAELQAMSLGFRVNIVIHQLDKPRWEVVNWPLSQKTIHLSYHNGEHYSSVRPREGHKLPSVSEAKPSEARPPQNNNNDNNAPPEESVSAEVALVMAATDCGDVEMVKQTLVENLYDVQAAINYILLLQETGDGHSMAKPQFEEIPEEDNYYEEKNHSFEPSDADKRATKWEDASGGGAAEPRQQLPVYRGNSGKGGKGNKKQDEEPSDPRVALARRIVALEASRKLSNKDRQQLKQLRKEAENKGLDVEELVKTGNAKPKAGKAAEAYRPPAADADEEEIDRLMQRVRDLGTIKI
jgi:hypothetical protein